MKSIRLKVGYERLFDVNKYFLARALKINFHHLLFFYSFYIDFLSLKEFLGLIKATIHAFVICFTCSLFSVD